MELIITLIVLIFSAILHEVAHGYVADRLGDPTARLAGRLTLNPKSHIDPFMSILLPLLLLIGGSPVIFGAAKPVPVDPFNLKDGRKDIALVSLAGPLTNIILAISASFILKGVLYFFSVSSMTEFAPFLVILIVFLKIIIQINLLLAIFNLLPIPPLDGSKIFALILPEKEAGAYLSLGSIGIFILFFLLSFPIGGFSLGEMIFRLLNFSLSLLAP
ncbi:MAG: site-2 protease family protein [Candidatus Berkelbacteria bacterium]|nr:site-2 protease family protein [Candidatus Berkelbacteria bacterium]